MNVEKRMILRTSRRGVALFFALALVCAAPLGAVDESADTGRDPYSLLFYGGTWSQTNFVPILTEADTDYRESYLAVAALNYLLHTNIRDIQFETEGQLGKHFGIMRHTELNGLLIARWRFSRDLPFSIALGEGLSWASKRPRLEHRRKDIYEMRFREQRTKRLLNYLMVELDMRVYEDSPLDPRVFVRIHHRSGVFGTYCPPTCGSNFVTYGVKLSI